MYILCEGQTEDGFVKEVLAPYMLPNGIFVTPLILSTKRIASGKKYKGGGSQYSKIRTELEILCKGDPTAFVTTMFDYYKLPNDTPGKGATGDIYEIAREIESAVRTDLGGQRNLLVNLIMHEFEGLLFSDISAFSSEAKADEKAILELGQIKSGFKTPEHINDSELTAPSRRIMKILPEYSKTLNGISIAKRIGIKKIAEECLHFGEWIEHIRELGLEGVQ